MLGEIIIQQSVFGLSKLLTARNCRRMEEPCTAEGMVHPFGVLPKNQVGTSCQRASLLSYLDRDDLTQEETQREKVAVAP